MRGAIALLAAAIAVTLPGVAASGGAEAALARGITNSVTVAGTANIFGAGEDAPPDPGGGGGGTLPIEIDVVQGTSVFTFPRVKGQTDCCNQSPATPPDGGVRFDTGVTAFGGISGVSGSGEMFLVGVFLGDGPKSPAPVSFGPFNDDLKNRARYKPVLQQVFFIGNGRRDDGLRQVFDAPEGATRLFLGFAGSSGFDGPPGHYADNTGSLLVKVQPRVLCEGEKATIIGTSGPDTILGTPQADVIAAGGGDDFVVARGGDDTVCLGDGDDTAFGAGGDDLLLGEDGIDTLSGGRGEDDLRGGRHADVLHGGKNSDDIDGGPGRDEIYGQSGSDHLRGGSGNDFLSGGPGGDTLEGGAGTDVLAGRDGNDTLRGQADGDFLSGHGDDDRLFGGGGADDADGGVGFDTCRAEVVVGCEA